MTLLTLGLLFGLGVLLGYLYLRASEWIDEQETLLDERRDR